MKATMDFFDKENDVYRRPGDIFDAVPARAVVLKANKVAEDVPEPKETKSEPKEPKK
jgi:hypothetical protein